MNNNFFSLLWRIALTIFTVFIIVGGFVFDGRVGIGALFGAFWVLKYTWEGYADF